MTSIGLVTVLYNSLEMLPDFFKSVAAQKDIEYKIYLVDNSPNLNPEKDIQQIAEEYNIWQHCMYLPNKENVGVAAGNNIGVKKALQDLHSHILILNNDILFEDEYLFKYLLDKEVEGNHKIVGPLIYYYGTKVIWFVKEIFTNYNVFIKAIGIDENDQGQFPKELESECGPTCFLLFNREVFEEVGLFDENYFVYIDDTDYLRRCYNKGLNIKVFTQKTIEHKVSQSTGGKYSDFSYFYALRNRLYYCYKFYRSFQRYYGYAFLLVRFLVLGKKFNPSLYFKAIRSFISLTQKTRETNL